MTSKSCLKPASLLSGGYCRRCGKVHTLTVGESKAVAEQLMQRLEQEKSIDLFSNSGLPSPELSTSSLFGEDRGKMFGVLECTEPSGKPRIIYAFSGQFNGRYLVAGWAPPLFNVDQFERLTFNTEKQIKLLGRRIEDLPRMSEEWLSLRSRRRKLSQSLMQEIQMLYGLHNFRGETSSLPSAFVGSQGMPTGTGDCCAPKLLNQAARLGLKPKGLCEFFWGKENKSGTLQHAMITTACAEKCEPILGFLLCGLGNDHGPS